MNIPTDRWKEWEGRLVDGKFPLRRWLGNSDHSAVFVTDHNGISQQRSVIKLVDPKNLDANAQLSLWAEAAKLSHPHLIRLFECGRCTIDDAPLLYVVMEYAEENLAEIIPVRPLSGDEALEVLRPSAEALAFLHGSGFVHSRIKPSNILAVGDQLRLSSDGLRKLTYARHTTSLTGYDAPEVPFSGFAPASDIWSLGATLVSVLKQKEPIHNELKTNNMGRADDAALLGTPERLRRIVRLCMQFDPAKRPTAQGILRELSGQSIRKDPVLNASVTHRPRNHPGRRIALPVLMLAAVLLIVLVAGRFMGHEPSTPASEAPPLNSPAGNLSAKSSTVTGPKTSASGGLVRGSVLNQVMPEVSANALHTIKGRIKVGVEVAVDTAGNVSRARLASSGPSRYFSSRSLAAARQWKFSPARLDGESIASEWILRFQFGRGSTQVVPSELKP
jgi:TonB family protein